MPANSPDKFIRRHPVVRWLLGAGALWYVLSRFVPFTPTEFRGILDGSWMQVLHVAFIEHWQFGRDIVFTYGPWGFLYGGSDPATHLISVTVWTILSVTFWCAAWRASTLCFNDRLYAWLWLMAFCMVAGVTISMNLDFRLNAWIVLLLLLHFFAEDHWFTKTEFSLVVSLGLLRLIKFSIFISAGMAVLVIATDNVWRQRRFPWILPVFGASLVFFWELAGQYLSSLVPFICNSWQITSGYTEAMSLTSVTGAMDVCLFLAAAALLGALAGYMAWKRHRWFGMLHLAGLGFVVFVAFKYGYVRNDDHEVTATIQLLIVALACLAMVQKFGSKVILSAFLTTIVILLLTSVTYIRYSDKGFIPVLVQSLSEWNIGAPLAFLFAKDTTLADHEKFRADIRRKFPIPLIEGSVDVYSYNQTAILAHGLHYHPRPIIQSYSAYTPELAELNTAHLRSKLAPDNILFQVASIDNHYPALDDGCSWPELLTRYDITDITGTNQSFVLMKRSPAPRKYQMTLLENTNVPFGKPVALSPLDAGPIWVEFEINKSLSGTVISTLYKPPVLLLTVSLRDGQQKDFRLIPGMARSGFLLSPLVSDQKSFVQLAAQDGSNALANLEVISVTVSIDNGSGRTICYQSPFRLRLYRLDYPRQNLNKIENESFMPKPGQTN